MDVYRLRGVSQRDVVGDLVLTIDDNSQVTGRFEAWSRVEPDPERHLVINWRGHVSVREGSRYRMPAHADMAGWFFTYDYRFDEEGWVSREDPRVIQMAEWERHYL